MASKSPNTEFKNMLILNKYKTNIFNVKFFILSF